MKTGVKTSYKKKDRAPIQSKSWIVKIYERYNSRLELRTRLLNSTPIKFKICELEKKQVEHIAHAVCIFVSSYLQKQIFGYKVVVCKMNLSVVSMKSLGELHCNLMPSGLSFFSQDEITIENFASNFGQLGNSS